MLIYRKHIILMMILLALIVSACSLSQSSNPTSEAKKLFEEWALQAGVPYKNASYEVITNDGAFATVRVTVDLRTSATESWLEKQADVECRHIGSEWQCNSAFAFSLTEAEQSRQNEFASGTATASAIKLQATASELERQAEATQEAIKNTQAVVELYAKATETAISQAATAAALSNPVSPESNVFQIDVFANKGWQDTGISIIQGNKITIEHKSGLWFTGAADGGGHDASGGPNPWICSWPQCHEPLHDFPKYALIGKIGNTTELLRIGNHLDFVASTNGSLYLRPNYGDQDIAVFNPEGSITVEITVH